MEEVNSKDFSWDGFPTLKEAIVLCNQYAQQKGFAIYRRTVKSKMTKDIIERQLTWNKE